MVAEISVSLDNQILVHRITSAIDCGRVVNPDTVCAQVEGAVAFGLPAVLKEAISIESGAVRQQSFADYPILTFAEMLRVEGHILPSEAHPGGVGDGAGSPPRRQRGVRCHWASLARFTPSHRLNLRLAPVAVVGGKGCYCRAGWLTRGWILLPMALAGRPTVDEDQRRRRT